MSRSLLLMLASLVITAAFNLPMSRLRQCTRRCAAPPLKVELTEEKKLFFSQKSFQSLGLSPTMIECASTLNIDRPSKIQALSYYGITTGKPCIIADQTGSGKTLAYLLPTVQRMINERKVNGAVKRVSPSIVVMTPTAELAM